MLLYLLQIRFEEFVLFSTGWTTMGSEILVIFAFQVFFGYIYLEIGIIITVFLAGLLPGAWFGQRFARRPTFLLVLIDGLLILLLAIFLIVLVSFGDHVSRAFFLAFGFSVSLACGFQFPVALRLQKDDAHSATRFFSADLMGAACGSLITSLVLIPLLGIYWTAMSLIGLKLISILIVGVNHVRFNPKTFSVL
jgi:spermidine synthase